MCYALREFAHEHPGVFEAICWHNSYTSELNHEITKMYIDTCREAQKPCISSTESREVREIMVAQAAGGIG